MYFKDFGKMGNLERELEELRDFTDYAPLLGPLTYLLRNFRKKPELFLKDRKYLARLLLAQFVESAVIWFYAASTSRNYAS